jgi:hypothetical protein
MGSNSARWSTAAATDPRPLRGDGPAGADYGSDLSRLFLAALFVSPDILQDVL